MGLHRFDGVHLGVAPPDLGAQRLHFGHQFRDLKMGHVCMVPPASWTPPNSVTETTIRPSAPHLTAEDVQGSLLLLHHVPDQLPGAAAKHQQRLLQLGCTHAHTHPHTQKNTYDSDNRSTKTKLILPQIECFSSCRSLTVTSQGMAQVSRPLTPPKCFGSLPGASESSSSTSSDWLKCLPFSVTC